MKPGSSFSMLIHLRVSHTPHYILQKLDNEAQDRYEGGRVSRRADAVGGFRRCGRLDGRRLWLPGSVCAHARVHCLNCLPAALCASFHVPITPARRPSSCPSFRALFGRGNEKRSYHPASRVLEHRPLPTAKAPIQAPQPATADTSLAPLIAVLDCCISTSSSSQSTSPKCVSLS
ncbi:hypothetical protein FA15DRAFT_309427 [Coprinopsis marcescibilis]|uniref:Uncharacterized protein n=1 Tax=Coprinopsis marcescibilis TaxID=230819 RepID=A0A5C3KC99_COPMA|nr:hypothetical protein FA15DRAFT_309427 [Coprinopsis marcescibilis]